MTKLSRKLLILLAAFFLPALLSGNVARSQDLSYHDYLPVEVMQVWELPTHVTNPLLLKSEKGYVLKCSISNNSDTRILGFTYRILVLDSDSKLRMTASRTADLELTGYATRDLTLRPPGNLDIKSGDRVIMSVEQLIGEELVWEVLNSRLALEAYGRGDYLVPEVKQVLNQVDSKPIPRVIY
jgi:hypothetical protein